jgi:hypothetical protein
MMLTIQSISEVSTDRFRVFATLGDSSVKADLEVSDVDGLTKFNIVGEYFSMLLHLGGLCGSFAKWFFSYLDNRVPELPTELGELLYEDIAKAKRYAAKWNDGPG